MRLRVVLAAAALVFAVLAASGGALAGSIGGAPPSFSVDVTASAGAPLHLIPTLTPGAGGTFTGEVSQSQIDVVSILFDVSLNADPAISGSFTLTNLSGSPQTFSVSATVSVLPLAGPTKIGGSYGDATYTDTNGSEDVTIASNPFYQAQIDGAGVRNLGNFNLTASGGAGIFGTISQESFGTPIPSEARLGGVSSSIGVAFPGFTLTAGDSVHVPFEFVVSVPEPAFAPLFAIGTAAILCAFAQKRASIGSAGSGRIPPTGG
jgi:hypothetical protein